MVKSSTNRGRKTAIYYPEHGDPVVGLFRLGDGRWRASGTEKYTFSERDETLAIQHFLEWKARQTGSNLGTIQNYADIDAAMRDRTSRAKEMERGEVTINVPRDHRHAYSVTDSSLRPDQWNWLRRQIIEQPKWVAARVGIEQIAYITDLKEPTTSATLKMVGDLYLEHAKISSNWLSKSKIFWNEFVASVEVNTLRELTQEMIVDYGDEVKEAGTSPAHSRQRFGAIKAIINFPTKRGKWAEDAKRALAFCAVLVPPRAAAVDPKPIAPADFAKLLEHADAEGQAALLLSLNACQYAGEVAVVKWSELNLDKGTLVTNRNKTGIIRIAALWPRTVEALRKLTRRTDSVFLTEFGTPADYLHVYRLFKRIRKAAKLKAVQFSQIRDGAYSAAAEAGVDLNLCRMLAGHSVGISDAYIQRRPGMVQPACKAIAEAYGIK